VYAKLEEKGIDGVILPQRGRMGKDGLVYGDPEQIIIFNRDVIRPVSVKELKRNEQGWIGEPKSALDRVKSLFK